MWNFILAIIIFGAGLFLVTLFCGGGDNDGEDMGSFS